MQSEQGWQSASLSDSGETSRVCGDCVEVVSPRPRPERKGRPEPRQPDVGSGHGRKVPGWCTIPAGLEDEKEDGEQDKGQKGQERSDQDFQAPRVRTDRPKGEIPETTRQTRSMTRSGTGGSGNPTVSAETTAIDSAGESRSEGLDR